MLFPPRRQNTVNRPLLLNKLASWANAESFKCRKIVGALTASYKPSNFTTGFDGAGAQIKAF